MLRCHICKSKNVKIRSKVNNSIFYCSSKCCNNDTVPDNDNSVNNLGDYNDTNDDYDDHVFIISDIITLFYLDVAALVTLRNITLLKLFNVNLSISYIFYSFIYISYSRILLRNRDYSRPGLWVNKLITRTPINSIYIPRLISYYYYLPIIVCMLNAYINNDMWIYMIIPINIELYLNNVKSMMFLNALSLFNSSLIRELKDNLMTISFIFILLEYDINRFLLSNIFILVNYVYLSSYYL